MVSKKKSRLSITFACVLLIAARSVSAAHVWVHVFDAHTGNPIPDIFVYTDEPGPGQSGGKFTNRDGSTYEFAIADQILLKGMDLVVADESHPQLQLDHPQIKRKKEINAKYKKASWGIRGESTMHFAVAISSKDASCRCSFMAVSKGDEAEKKKAVSSLARKMTGDRCGRHRGAADNIAGKRRGQESGRSSTERSRSAPRPRLGSTFTNSVGMKLAYIPPGEFMMGSPSNEQGRDNNVEGAQHRVRISRGFYMGVTEVTQKQWKAVMRSNPSNYKGDDLPVEQVFWKEAGGFCKKLTQREGKLYRLPTEAEWEYACRAGTSTRYSFGDSDSLLSSYAWYSDNSNPPHAVGKLKPNPWGLYDMHGNLWEWCSDRFGKYPSALSVDPQGPSSGDYRVVRGGAWESSSRACRSAQRGWGSHTWRHFTYAFRVIMEIDKGGH